MVILKEKTSTKKQPLSEAGISLWDVAADRDYETFAGARIESLCPSPESTIIIDSPIFRRKVYKSTTSVSQINFEDRSGKIKIFVTRNMKVTPRSSLGVVLSDGSLTISLYK